MGSISPYIPAPDVEATVSSKGQVTLPVALRNHLGIHTNPHPFQPQPARGVPGGPHPL